MRKLAKVSEIIPLIKAGKSYQAIAEIYGVHESTVHRWVRLLKNANLLGKVQQGRKKLEL